MTARAKFVYLFVRHLVSHCLTKLTFPFQLAYYRAAQEVKPPEPGWDGKVRIL
jgi:hypothetical protein